MIDLRAPKVTKEEIERAWNLWLEVDAGKPECTITDEECIFFLGDSEALKLNPRLALAFREIRKEFPNSDAIFRRIFALIALWTEHVPELNVLFREDGIHRVALWAAASAPMSESGEFLQDMFGTEASFIATTLERELRETTAMNRASESVN